MNAFFSNGRIRIPPGLLILLFIGAGLGVFFIAASPASASIINGLGVLPTATQENLWAFADIPKPTYTATAVAIPADTPVPATETPGSIVMEIVEDISVPAAQESVSRPVVSYGGSKYILVDISEQHMYVYEGDAILYSFVASTGKTA